MRIITGTLRGRLLKTTEGKGYRPATGKVREALFSVLTSKGVIWEDIRVLDLFAGSGSLGFEATSRGAAEACFVEKSPKAIECLYHNIKKLGLDKQSMVIAMDVERFLQGSSITYDIIFVDPPYGENRLQPTIDALVEKQWVSHGGYVVAEVEIPLHMNFSQIHPQLNLLSSRSYGQTRTLIWKTNDHS